MAFTTLINDDLIHSVIDTEKSMITCVDKQYKFFSTFNLKTGFYLRSGIIENGQDTGKDPFMGSYPHLMDIGIMGHCIHGKSGMCIKSGVECYQNGRDINKPNMTMSDYLKILNQLKGRTFQVALGGRGDVNKHEEYESILSVSRENHVVPNFTTSGFGLTDKEVEIAAKYVGAVAVSEYRSDYTKSAIERFVAAGVTTNLHYVLGNQSIDDAIDRLTRDDFYKGINAVIFLAHKPVGLGSSKNVLKVTDPRIQKFFDLIDGKQHPYLIGFDSCNVPGIINHTKNINLMSVDACEAARYSCYATSDMKMLPCSFDVGGMKWATDLNTTSIKDAWDSLLFENFRDSFRKSCPDCGKKENCFGGCPITNEITLCKEKQ